MSVAFFNSQFQGNGIGLRGRVAITVRLLPVSDSPWCLQKRSERSAAVGVDQADAAGRDGTVPMVSGLLVRGSVGQW